VKDEDYKYKGGRVLLFPLNFGGCRWEARYKGKIIDHGTENTKHLARQKSEATITKRIR